MKKTICSFFLAIMIMSTFLVTAFAEEVSDCGNGMTNVRFANGYVGFCIDSQKHGTGNGDTFTPSEDTSTATNNRDNSDISQKLKIMFTQCFDMIFTPDGNGSYYITKDVADIGLQNAIYSFSDNYWVSGVSKTLVNAVNDYTGPDIPDEGYQITAENGDIITFYFAVMEPQKEDQQSFFAYKLEVSQESEHKHEHSTDWSSDEKEHWHECDCGDKKDIGKHEGTAADCSNSSVCEVCNKELAPVNPDIHTGNTVVLNKKDATEFEDGYTGDIYCDDCDVLIESGEVIPATHEHEHSTDWSSDEKEHWHECDCGDKKDIGKHEGNTADCSNASVCKICNKELAPVNPEKHTGNTVVLNKKDATEFKNGYTGDTCCADCGTIITSGKVIYATHEHVYNNDWSHDDDYHWQECNCGDKSKKSKHEFDDGICSVCGLTVESEEDIPTDGSIGSSGSEEENTIIFVPVTTPEADNDSEDEVINTPADDEYTDSILPDTGSENELIFVSFILATGFIMFMISKSRKKVESDK